MLQEISEKLEIYRRLYCYIYNQQVKCIQTSILRFSDWSIYMKCKLKFFVVDVVMKKLAAETVVKILANDTAVKILGLTLWYKTLAVDTVVKILAADTVVKILKI